MTLLTSAVAVGTRTLAAMPNVVEDGHNAEALGGCGPGFGIPFVDLWYFFAWASAVLSKSHISPGNPIVRLRIEGIYAL
jgi:hypothetical protein